jgi:hypothetical protein
MPFKGRVTLIDAGGNTANRTYALQATAYADAKTAFSTILAALNNLTDAVIRKSSLVEDDPSGVDQPTVLPVGEVAVEKQASFTASLVDKPQSYAFSVPAPVNIWLANSGPLHNQVDLSNTDVDEYIQAITNATFVSDGDEIDTVIKGLRTHRGSTKG